MIQRETIEPWTREENFMIDFWSVIIWSWSLQIQVHIPLFLSQSYSIVNPHSHVRKFKMSARSNYVVACRIWSWTIKVGKKLDVNDLQPSCGHLTWTSLSIFCKAEILEEGPCMVIQGSQVTQRRNLFYEKPWYLVHQIIGQAWDDPELERKISWLILVCHNLVMVSSDPGSYSIVLVHNIFHCKSTQSC